MFIASENWLTLLVRLMLKSERAKIWVCSQPLPKMGATLTNTATSPLPHPGHFPTSLKAVKFFKRIKKFPITTFIMSRGGMRRRFLSKSGGGRWSINLLVPRVSLPKRLAAHLDHLSDRRSDNRAHGNYTLRPNLYRVSRGSEMSLGTTGFNANSLGRSDLPRIRKGAFLFLFFHTS